jgi:hypothetical protein
MVFLRAILNETFALVRDCAWRRALVAEDVFGMRELYQITSKL